MNRKFIKDNLSYILSVCFVWGSVIFAAIYGNCLCIYKTVVDFDSLKWYYFIYEVVFIIAMDYGVFYGTKKIIRNIVDEYYIYAQTYTEEREKQATEKGIGGCLLGLLVFPIILLIFFFVIMPLSATVFWIIITVGGLFCLAKFIHDTM